MKSSIALSLVLAVSFQQLAFAQEEEQNVPAMPTLPAPVTDIYWWKTLLTGDEINNYLTGPATEAATAPATEAATATATQDAVTQDAATPTVSASEEVSASASESAASVTESAIESAVSSAASEIASLSAAVSETLSSIASEASVSPSSVAAWSSSASVYYSSATGVPIASVSSTSPRPSGAIIPPSTTSNPVTTSAGSHVIADMSKMILSVTIAAILGNMLN
ncbi:hypothetical protein HMPREF1544_07740 [Mucor circinelloides 1006PhL]|uniref:Uncharacterized protein n=1 Tax=Mucor circinelloides f. circinelloides (strain 1006PhL) TaxID=1220926 RepID=S2JAM8_MUCC1|nr:hypothetical protein HMPREF1544_07740 [Mucor circinelloides 1006PhL]